LIIADASEDYADIGKSIEIINTDNQKLLAGLHTYIARDLTHKMSLGFSGYLMQTESVRLQIKTLATGISVLGISKVNLRKVKLNIPSLPEQTKIANFLTAVDDKITLLTKKADLLSQYKKGVMQQIFSQELRFKDDDGQEFPEWGIKKLSDEDIYISDGNYGEQYPKANELKQAGVPFIRANNMSGLSLSWADMKFIDNSLHEMLTSGHLETDDILITTRGEIGMVAYVNSDFNGANINAQICLIRIKDKHKINSKYLVQLLSSSFCQRQFKELQTGSALKQLPKKNLSQVDFYCPITEEQNKIANFLTAIDEKITSNQTQLDAVKQYKQGLLQQMFV
jgi:type I restriction enzyme S subunit